MLHLAYIMDAIHKNEWRDNNLCYYAEAITEEIMEIYSTIRGLGNKEIFRDPSNVLNNVFQRLDRLIALDICDKRAEEILSSSQFSSTFEAFTRFRSLYTVKLETEQAKRVLASRDPWGTLQQFAYIANYLQLARTEFQGAGLKPDDRVLFLGCGPLPLSLIVLCARYGLQGVGIEEKRKRAELARRVVEQLGLSGQIEIVEGNHFSLPLKEREKSERVELVMVAAQAEPKQEIFDHLAAMLPAGTKVSYRIYEKGLRRLLDTFSSYEFPWHLEEYLRLRPKPPANNTVVFLTTTTQSRNETILNLGVPVVEAEAVQKCAACC